MSSPGSPAGAPHALPEFNDLSLERLQLRRSAKWTTYPADVLPAFVAEMDFPLAEPIREALEEAVERSDTGYPSPAPLGAAFADFAAARFDWRVDPANVRAVADVMTGVSELLAGLTVPGDQVALSPPIYPPFFSVTSGLRRQLEEAPLTRSGVGFELDLDALEQSFAHGARVYLLSQPHNPTGRSFRRDELEGLAALAVRYGVLVVSDEIHAPLTLPGASHVPFLSLGGEACDCGVAIVGASKAWNIAGLKCALIVTASPAMEARLTAALSTHLRYHVGQFGVVASIAAFEDGTPWLDSAAGPSRRQPRPARKAPRRASAGRRLRAAGGWLPRLARLPRARPRRRPCRDLPRARPGRTQFGTRLRHAGPRLRAPQLRDLFDPHG